MEEIKRKTTTEYSFCYSTITCKINNNNERRYFIGQAHSQDCQNISTTARSLFSETIKNNNAKDLNHEFITKINEYINNNKSICSLKLVKG